MAAIGSWVFGMLGMEANNWIGAIICGTVGAVILIAIGRAIKK